MELYTIVNESKPYTADMTGNCYPVLNFITTHTVLLISSKVGYFVKHLLAVTIRQMASVLCPNKC